MPATLADLVFLFGADTEPSVAICFCGNWLPGQWNR